MKSLKYSIFIVFALSIAAIYSCKDESLNPVPGWDSAPHGFGSIATTDSTYSITVKGKTISLPVKDSSWVGKVKKAWVDSFSSTNPTRSVRLKHYWQSLDKKTTVSEIKFFVYWDEAYTDKNNDARTARHAGFIYDSPGKLLKTVSSPDGDYKTVIHNISTGDLYNLFKDAQFDYGKGAGKGNVIDGTVRTAAKPFTPKDKFFVRWEFKLADGRLIDRWGSTNICAGEVAGANCVTEFYVSKR